MSAFPETQLALRQEIITTCRQLGALGLNQGTSGNISVRVGMDLSEGFLLTPTSLDYAAMEPADLVHVSPNGDCSGRRRPSSELPFHRAIMAARADARGCRRLDDRVLPHHAGERFLRLPARRDRSAGANVHECLLFWRHPDDRSRIRDRQGDPDRLTAC